VYYYLKWALHYLYGRYLNQMKACLKELEGWSCPQVEVYKYNVNFCPGTEVPGCEE
jgi:hypothetical protein